MKKIILISLGIIFIAFTAFYFSYFRYNRLPDSEYIIYVGYYKCEKCHSLIGGLWGKGGVKDLRTEKAKSCIHEWVEIDRDEFLLKAEEWQEFEWVKDPGFLYSY